MPESTRHTIFFKGRAAYASGRRKYRIVTLQIGKSDFGLLKSNAPDYNQMRRIFGQAEISVHGNQHFSMIMISSTCRVATCRDCRRDAANECLMLKYVPQGCSRDRSRPYKWMDMTSVYDNQMHRTFGLNPDFRFDPHYVFRRLPQKRRERDCLTTKVRQSLFLHAKSEDLGCICHT